ncbi:helix-turn-helix transcriptional regulator [Clostridium felsineum]|uniref:Uncharacterized protein n=1 Tax=Clostridium felsineum TaxID=36839 RepID=A0A1S8L3A3_9CLOT|nr:helix-turn-helix domain-containing protein [Clostridium felsineum]URZ07561.1 hypothetical protein CLROS_029000 [Clostridium felsineum]URZ12592.1 hypothetical protein CROST_033150 [Clostridium felsineum]
MINNRLKEIRGELSQKLIAESIGITQQQYSKIERNVGVPSFEVALKISHFFRKSVEEIFFMNLDNN